MHRLLATGGTTLVPPMIIEGALSGMEVLFGSKHTPMNLAFISSTMTTISVCGIASMLLR